MSGVFRNAIILLCACGLLAACGRKQLTEASVRQFVDAADEAFVKGKSGAICNARSRNFVLTVTEFDLAPNRIVADFAEAQQIVAEREAAHELITGKTSALKLRELCFDAYFSRAQYKRTKLQRGPLQITIDPDGRRAVVRAHYTIWEPVEARGDSPLGGYTDSIEHQIGTKQTEADDESVVILEDGVPKFAATTSVSKWFRIPSQRDSRL
jgi:hypothetical protein